MRAKRARKQSGNDQFGGTSDSSAVVNLVSKSCSVRLERFNFINMERDQVISCSIHLDQKDFHQETDSNQFQCSVKLNRKDFTIQEQFVVPQTSTKNPSGTSTRNETRTQPKRIRSHVDREDQAQFFMQSKTEEDQPSQPKRIQPKRNGNRGVENKDTYINTTTTTQAKKTKPKPRETSALCMKRLLNTNVRVEVNQLVLAKQKYSVPWPSQIKEIGSKSVTVYFFGDGRCGPVKIDDLYSIEHSHDIMTDCLKRNIRNYRKGIIEMERILNISNNLDSYH